MQDLPERVLSLAGERLQRIAASTDVLIRLIDAVLRPLFIK